MIGEMTEWLKVPAWEASIRQNRIGGRIPPPFSRHDGRLKPNFVNLLIIRKKRSLLNALWVFYRTETIFKNCNFCSKNANLYSESIVSLNFCSSVLVKLDFLNFLLKWCQFLSTKNVAIFKKSENQSGGSLFEKELFFLKQVGFQSVWTQKDTRKFLCLEHPGFLVIPTKWDVTDYVLKLAEPWKSAIHDGHMDFGRQQI